MKCFKCQKQPQDIGCAVRFDNIIQPSCRTCMAVYSTDMVLITTKESEFMKSEINKRSNEYLRHDGQEWFTERTGKTIMIKLITKDTL